jgi:hypothetical protein
MRVLQLETAYENVEPLVAPATAGERHQLLSAVRAADVEEHGGHDNAAWPVQKKKWC